jgi:hypothetical protein
MRYMIETFDHDGRVIAFYCVDQNAGATLCVWLSKCEALVGVRMSEIVPDSSKCPDAMMPPAKRVLISYGDAEE